MRYLNYWKDDSKAKSLINESIGIFLTDMRLGEFLEDMDDLCPFCNNEVKEDNVHMVDGDPCHPYETKNGSCPECGSTFNYNDCMGWFLRGFPTNNTVYLLG